ncbi:MULTISPECIES: anhydro-N-acetylmuramic acid kinase [Marinobacter]|jgi:anhydro-N-acetylmuramic acid kinase|uniref:anhydro-N-acetylmuramic acid kinase n=1 Tax=Marinobacter TaxID=2742 RepID=UPI001259E6AB|nr:MULTISPECIES: anhydro-N-acetylmuramic acid kinase [Marinobacter]MDC8457529.1 anhydro-N-acetylmuramic acid kinase [Marinobacter sp. DS40M6]VVT13240.1 anhydro-N-acetylmuramic acid kinase [Marinobacter salarius]VXB27654.1 anhydro-N-acetylmuramic acid kinase [Marinobacter salarius]|tara:strand:- start:329 stop:1426 length:1098 start_codon:yes stop_codon:yes gene_type:complete
MKAWIGLMSGTSMDGIDAILVSFNGQTIQVHATHTTAYPDDIRRRLVNLGQNRGTPDDVGELDHAVGSLFALAAETVIGKSGFPASSINAIGSHGQTLRHHPDSSAPFSLQIGDPTVITERTGITTVADFRRRDLAAGGQGAPLVPAFHKAFFSAEGESRCILNLGGIANITHLPAGANEPITGFDTGPANALMDAWCMDQTGRAFDEDGAWAKEGEINQALLSDLLSDAYFSRQPPKSTGTEKFNIEWIRTQLRRHPDLSGADVQRTLLELTAVSVAQQLPQSPGMTIFACGGGAKNRILMRALQRTCSPARLASTDDLGLDPQWVEPAAFAWLASQTLAGKPGNVPEVTGAEGKRILGAVYYA